MKSVRIATIVFGILQCNTVSGFSSVPRQTHSLVKNHRSRAGRPLSFFNKKKEEVAAPVVEVIQGVGDEGCALPSPSGVNTLAEPVQAAIVAGIFAVLGLGTVALSSFLDNITLQYEWVQSWRYTWPLLGGIYAAAGVTHFTLQEQYENITPPNKTWGIWYVPGSKAFHVQWTGLVEFIAGLGLLIGGALDAFAPVWYSSPNILSPAGIGSDSAAALLLLTIAVTPANIYMYTHGARLPIDGPPVPVVGHAIRGIMQIVLFSLLYQMGQGTFDSLLSPS